MRTRDTLLVLGTVTALPASSLRLGAQMQSPARYEVSGIVIDEGKAPIPSAELALMRRGEASRLVRSGADGRFSFTNVRPGPIALTVRRIGYKATSVDVDVSPAGAVPPVEIELQEVASDIDDVIVEASKGHLREFYAHKGTNNFGKFFDQKDIERLARSYVSEVFRGVPGATIQASDRTGNRILLRGCSPTVWVDGIRAAGAEVDEVARPSDLAGMEVYPSWAGLPIQYQDRDNRMCGVIVLWTRSQ
jgi:Carboxypeptidase regulatory-like domain/TonB-dependent Receptor Plug Domain